MQALHSISAIASVEFVENLDQAMPLPRRPKVYRCRTDPFKLADEEFKRRYLFTKLTIRYIVELVRRDLEVDGRGCGISPQLQVLTAIRCWGRREVQDDAGDLHGISQPTVSRICAKVATAIAKHASTFIKMPQTLAEQQKTIRDFYEIKNFPNVIGCIDCTHIKIKKYGGDADSLNVQVTCDAKLCIRDIVVRWQGSTHDAQIFNESTLKERFENGEFKGHLLGDSGYKLEPYLFTPILRPQNRSEEKYNEAHIHTHNTVERCFGVWKQRFQCLLHGMTMSMKNTKIIIVALAILHNIAIEKDDPVTDIDESYVLPEEYEPINNIGNESRVRGSNSTFLRAFINRYFSE